MKPGATWIGVLAGCAGGLFACSKDDGPPTLELDTEVRCEDAVSCISAGVEEYEIDGVRVLHERLPGHPLLAMELSFPSENLSGTQVWAESLAFTLFNRSGSQRFNSATWDAELLRLGANVTATLGFDYSHIDLLAPLPSWRAVWDLVVESVSHPNLSDYEMDFYRKQAQRRFLSELDDPEAAARIDAFSRQFRGDAYNLARDSQAALAAVSQPDLVLAWYDLFERRRLLVTVVGDVDRAALDSAVRSLASVLHPNAPPSFAKQASSPTVQPEVAVLPYADSPTWYIDSYFRGPAGYSADYAAFCLGLEVLDQRMFREVRDVRGLAYTTGASASVYRNSYGRLWVTSESPREALPIIRQIIADLQTVGPSQDDLVGASARLRTALYGYADDPAGLARFLTDWALTAGAGTAIEDYLNALDQTSPGQVAATLSAYLRGVKTAAAGSGGELSMTDLSTLFVRP